MFAVSVCIYIFHIHIRYVTSMFLLCMSVNYFIYIHSFLINVLNIILLPNKRNQKRLPKTFENLLLSKHLFNKMYS